VCMLTVTVEDPEVVKMSQDYCRHDKARKHVCGWRIWPLSVGGSCEYEWELIYWEEAHIRLRKMQKL
jgi:hypothetical protein